MEKLRKKEEGERPIFSTPGDWVATMRSGTPTASVASLKKGRKEGTKQITPLLAPSAAWRK